MNTDRQMQLIAKAYSDQLRLVSRTITPQVIEAMRTQAEAAERARVALTPAIEAMIDNLNRATAGIDWDGMSAAVSQFATYQARVMEQIEPALERYREAIRRLPPYVQQAFLALAKHGWFMDPNIDLTQLWEFESSVRDTELAAAEELFCDYFDSRLDEIEESASANFPDRAGLLHQAFCAHKRGEYGLSIPVFLTQSDGMCYEVLAASLFSRRNGTPQTAAIVSQLEVTSFRRALLAPLMEPLPISAPERERGADFVGLNRHEILHGESVDYDTRVNSLKALSLLNYLSVVLVQDGADGP